MTLPEITLTLCIFCAAALLGGPIAAAITSAFSAGVLIGQRRRPR